ncbi:MAG: L,D-transpeptidase [Arhodomonas sp.]|nr:L,D-transpeptidase [Arhodomonas sp.]
MSPDGRWLHVSLVRQRLTLLEGRGTLAVWPVSTGTAGAGERQGSGATPRGWHHIRARIGAELPADAVLVGRRPTGERYSPALAAQHPGRDWILGRILWLSGLEVGRNRLGGCDTMRRYIYIHGAPPEVPLGRALSHGCVRMHPEAVVALFDRVGPGTRVLLE